MGTKSPNQDVIELLLRQFTDWPLLRDNYILFRQIRAKRLTIDGEKIRIQFNPSRMVSSCAKTDRQSLHERACFLCEANLPAEQEFLPFGEEYLILCNPYPIFPQHFTVPTRRHVEQSINGRLGDMLDLAKTCDAFTVFYNGPRSGASAPDHMHFQIVTHGYMPIDHVRLSRLELVSKQAGSDLYLLSHYLRNGWVITSDSKEAMASCFAQVCNRLEIPSGETEPMMNLFCNYQEGRWMLKVIPRKKHRPSQFFAEGDGRFLTSPGAADIGGVFITSRAEDFEKVTPALLRDIFGQVCFSNDEIRIK